MQISRHWRMNSNRYRLQGVRYGNGDVSVQNRPVQNKDNPDATEKEALDDSKASLSAA